jgi:hypothetical protein
MVSSAVGSCTSTGWNRRAAVRILLTYLRYSSSVVAPMQYNSPRASTRLDPAAASIAPSARSTSDDRLVDEQDHLAATSVTSVEWLSTAPRTRDI